MDRMGGALERALRIYGDLLNLLNVDKLGTGRFFIG